MTEKLGTIYVPDAGPDNARILLVGEAPGADEESQRTPFVGVSGQVLRAVINRCGADISTIRLANLCHYRPPGNRLQSVLETQEFTTGLNALKQHIRTYRPSVIGCLGNYPLFYLTGKRGITKYRGSILPYLYDPTIKCVAAFHPSYVSRDLSKYPIFDLDIKRIIKESEIDGLNYPEYKITVPLNGYELAEAEQRILSGRTITVDIETVKNTTRILCVGFGLGPREAIVIPAIASNSGTILRCLASDAKKILHNGAFDVAVLKENGILVNNYWFDTIIAAHVLTPELPRSLAFLASIYTRQIYYKAEGRSNIPSEDSKGDTDTKSWSEKFDRAKLYAYNGTDCCVTYEVYEQQLKELDDDPRNRRTFEFEMRMLPVAESIGSSGFLQDDGRRMAIQIALQRKWGNLQLCLDSIAGHEVNVNSTKQVPKFLYDELGLPPRRNRERGITTDEDAIVSLIAYCKGHLEDLRRPDAISDWEKRLIACKVILAIRGIRKLLSSYILVRRSNDGRVRCCFRVDGTETGRWSCKKYVDNSGLNMQTLPRDPVDVPDLHEPAKDVSGEVATLVVETEDDEGEGVEEQAGE